MHEMRSVTLSVSKSLAQELPVAKVNQLNPEVTSWAFEQHSAPVVSPAPQFPNQCGCCMSSLAVVSPQLLAEISEEAFPAKVPKLP